LLYHFGKTGNESRVFITEGNKTLNKGSILIKNADNNLENYIKNLGLDVQKTNSISDLKLEPIKLPRVAIYHNWYYTQDEGWARYTFETRKIPYTSIDKDDLRKGNLNNKFDVILLPDTYGNIETIIQGIDTKFSPMPFNKTVDYPNHGYPDSTDDMTGGPGFEGMANLKSFVENGGTIISLGNATKMVANTGITRELTTYNSGKLFHPGSIVTTKFRNTRHPIMNGFKAISHVFRGNSPLFQVSKYNRNHIVMQYGVGQLPDEKVFTGKIMGIPNYKPDSTAVANSKKPNKIKYVLSGMVKNEKNIVGQGAIFDIPVGTGHIVSFTFNPLHRFLNQHDEPLLWNAIINWDVIPK